jgi:hypothetical protein
MSFFVAILYTAILGVLFEHSFFIAPNGNNRGTRVVLYLNRNNVTISGSLLVLFIVDWICFHLLFGQAQGININLAEGWLLLAYLPATFCLGLSVVFSYESQAQGTKNTFCLTAALYHLFALIVEVIWLLVHIKKFIMPNPGAGNLIFHLMIVLILYVALRVFLIVNYFHCYDNSRGRLRAPILGFVALFVKPAFLLGINWAAPSLLVGGVQ